MNEKLEGTLLKVIVSINIAAQIHYKAGQELDMAADELKRFYLEIIEVKNGSEKEGETNP